VIVDAAGIYGQATRFGEPVILGAMGTAPSGTPIRPDPASFPTTSIEGYFELMTNRQELREGR